MESIIHLEYLTEDPEIREMIDMYWALDDFNKPLYNKHDFLPKYGLDTQRMGKKLNEYYNVFSLDDVCPECKEPTHFLKTRKDRYEFKRHWMCKSCEEKVEQRMKQFRVIIMQMALDELAYHSLSLLQLNIFKALIKKNSISDLAPSFGMSLPIFISYVRGLHNMNLLDYNQDTDEVIILEEYKELFKNDRPEKKVRSIFGPNNQKLYKHLKRSYPYVYPEIPVCTFIDNTTIDHLLIENWHKGYFLKCRVDALVCEENGEPRFAVEFQGSYHSEKQQKVKDELKKRIIEEAGIPLNYFTSKDLK